MAPTTEAASTEAAERRARELADEQRAAREAAEALAAQVEDGIRSVRDDMARLERELAACRARAAERRAVEALAGVRHEEQREPDVDTDALVSRVKRLARQCWDARKGPRSAATSVVVAAEDVEAAIRGPSPHEAGWKIAVDARKALDALSEATREAIGEQVRQRARELRRDDETAD